VRLCPSGLRRFGDPKNTRPWFWSMHFAEFVILSDFSPLEFFQIGATSSIGYARKTARIETLCKKPVPMPPDVFY